MLFVPVNPLRQFFKVQPDDWKLYFAVFGLFLPVIFGGHWDIVLAIIVLGMWFWIYLRITSGVRR